MAAARLVTWRLLLAAVIPGGARGPLPAGLSPGGTQQRGRDPMHSPVWGQWWPALSPTWEASGEPSGAGIPRSQRWGGGSRTRWSPPLQSKNGSGTPLGTEATVTGAGKGTWRNVGTAQAMAEEPLIAWHEHEARGQDGSWVGTRLPLAPTPGTLGPEVPIATGSGSPGPPWAEQDLSRAGQNVTGLTSTVSPQPTVSTIAPTPKSVAGTGLGTPDAQTGIHPGLRGPTVALAQTESTQLTEASSQLIPLGNAPRSTGPAQGSQDRSGSTELEGSHEEMAGLPISSPALPPPSSAPWVPFSAPSWGLARPWTQLLPAHQRSTRKAPFSQSTDSTKDTVLHVDPRLMGQQGSQPIAKTVLSTSTATPPASSMDTPGTSGTGLLPVEDVGSPQQVRGAVGPMSTPNATKATPQLTAHLATGTSGTKHTDIPGTQPPVYGTATPSATQRQAGLTTQPASTPQLQPSQTPLVPGANKTDLRWAELRHQLGFTWEAHVYGVAAIFLLLALGCLAALAGMVALHPPHMSHVLGAHGLLLAACLLRATFLLLDPYGARSRLPSRALLLLSTIPFPLLLSTFTLLLQRLQRLAQLQLLPAFLQGLPALGAAATMHNAVLGAADLLPPQPGLTPGLGLQALGCGTGVLLLLGGLWGCWRVLREPQEVTGGSRGLQWGSWVLLIAAVVGLPVCGLQLYSALWLREVLGPTRHFSWPGWMAQLWLRIGELGMVLALLVAAAEPLCCRCHHQSSTGHSCWAKALRYFCTGRKAEAPEYPNNCYDWASGSNGGTSSTGLERTPANDISKSLIRNPAEQLPLRALKDSNEAWAAAAGTTGMPGLSPKCPNVLAIRSCAAFEQGSSPSLGELFFRPPSPIDLRRSIDQALCRRHLLHDGLFGQPRRGSGTSLHSSLAPAETPGLGRMARCSSLTELPGSRHPPGTVTITVTASASSLESSSLKISWNPWRHGLSSPDSLPLDEAPSRAPLLVPTVPPAWEREGPRSFPILSKAMDTRSLSSDTIEL